MRRFLAFLTAIVMMATAACEQQATPTPPRSTVTVGVQAQQPNPTATPTATATATSTAPWDHQIQYLQLASGGGWWFMVPDGSLISANAKDWKTGSELPQPTVTYYCGAKPEEYQIPWKVGQHPLWVDSGWNTTYDRQLPSGNGNCVVTTMQLVEFRVNMDANKSNDIIDVRLPAATAAPTTTTTGGTKFTPDEECPPTVQRLRSYNELPDALKKIVGCELNKP